MKRSEWLTGPFWYCRLPDCFGPAFLCAACEADCYFGGRWMNEFLVSDEMIQKYKELVRDGHATTTTACVGQKN